MNMEMLKKVHLLNQWQSPDGRIVAKSRSLFVALCLTLPNVEVLQTRDCVCAAQTTAKLPARATLKCKRTTEFKPFFQAWKKYRPQRFAFCESC